MITVSDLTAGYERHPAIHHINAKISKGSLTAIIGPNGGGKSTLLKTLRGDLKPMEGSFSVGGNHIGSIPQFGTIDRNFPITVRDFAGFGLIKQTGLFAPFGKRRKIMVDDAIKSVGLTGFSDRYIGTLSGGELQRAVFARLKLQNADTLLLDEPFSAVDAKTTSDLVNLLETWSKDEGKTIIVVLHDLRLVRERFPSCMLLSREIIAQGATEDVLTDENIMRAYARDLAMNSEAKTCTRSVKTSHAAHHNHKENSD